MAVLLLAAAAVAAPLAGASHDRPLTAAQLCGAKDLDGIGLACARADGLLQIFSPDGEALGLSHGMDPVPPRSLVWPGGTLEPLAPACIESPTALEYHHKLLYVRAADDADRYARMAPQLVEMVGLANAILHDEGLPFGRAYDYVFDCAGGEVEVHEVVLPTPLASDSASTIFADLKALGHDDPRVKYWAWYDDTNACGCGGIGHVYVDDRASASNYNNGNARSGMVGITFGYTGLQGARIMMHENGHNMGAVQPSAPNADGGLHCMDGLDIMCYYDPHAPTTCAPGDGAYCENTCHGAMHFDCGHDDYFHPDPPAGSYLAGHWNVASPANRFLRIQSVDHDADGIADALDPDDDNDGIADEDDNCPTVANPQQADTNLDGIGDACQPIVRARGDRDGDGMPDRPRRENPLQGLPALPADNCILVVNPDQANLDGDRLGDACDHDDDGDNRVDMRRGQPADNCMPGPGRTYNPAQIDLDGDGLGDVCDEDDDGDGVADGADNCPVHANADQADSGGDARGDACDPALLALGARADRDGDGVPERRVNHLRRTVAFDNCPRVANPDQADHDGDGRGDACDPDPDNDGLRGVRDLWPFDHARLPFL